jgi:hypothetical protein
MSVLVMFFIQQLVFMFFVFYLTAGFLVFAYDIVRRRFDWTTFIDWPIKLMKRRSRNL